MASLKEMCCYYYTAMCLLKAVTQHRHMNQQICQLQSLLLFNETRQSFQNWICHIHTPKQKFDSQKAEILWMRWEKYILSICSIWRGNKQEKLLAGMFGIGGRAKKFSESTVGLLVPFETPGNSGEVACSSTKQPPHKAAAGTTNPSVISLGP